MLSFVVGHMHDMSGFVNPALGEGRVLRFEAVLACVQVIFDFLSGQSIVSGTGFFIVTNLGKLLISNLLHELV